MWLTAVFLIVFGQQCNSMAQMTKPHRCLAARAMLGVAIHCRDLADKKKNVEYFQPHFLT